MTHDRLRVVVDPNVFVSAAISPSGTTGQVVRAGFEGRFTVVVSPLLLAELERVLARTSFRRYLSLGHAREFVDAIEGVADVEADPGEVAAASRDPDDDYLLALAFAATADLVVSGDADLLELDQPQTPVISPRQLLGRLEFRT